VIDFPGLKPRILSAFSGYSPARFAIDISAGVTVGIVAIPLAMAFAIASGLKPEAGLVTAIIGGLFIAIMGGSPVQIGGPAGAFIVVVYAIVETHGVGGLLLATMMAGVLLIMMGLTRIGSLVRYIPVSIVIGFTNGIAVLIALSQIKDLLGLKVDPVPGEFFAKVATLSRHLGEADVATMLLSFISLVIVVAWPKSYDADPSMFRRVIAKIPGTIIALGLGIIVVRLTHLNVETIGTRFGSIPQGLPSLVLPSFEWAKVQKLFAPTITIALLCAVESLLCARVADSMIDDRHDPNQELVAQGLANMFSPLFGGFCATGTIARTVTNIRSGGRTPVAGIVHSLSVILVMIFAAPLAQDIPLASLAAILLFVAYNMGEWKQFARMQRFSGNYRAILVTTFLLTIVLDLTIAVEVGLAMACLFFITRVSSLTRLDPIEIAFGTKGAPPDVSIESYTLVGSLFFGSVSVLETLQNPRRNVPDITVLDLGGLLNLDTTGLEALENLDTLLARQGGCLILARLSGQPESLIQRSGFAAHLGPNRLIANLDQAPAIIRTHLQSKEPAPSP
jgi:SulP family sulfate permease